MSQLEDMIDVNRRCLLHLFEKKRAPLVLLESLFLSSIVRDVDSPGFYDPSLADA
jgi:hypothetical protein